MAVLINEHHSEPHLPNRVLCLREVWSAGLGTGQTRHSVTKQAGPGPKLEQGNQLSVGNAVSWNSSVPCHKRGMVLRRVDDHCLWLEPPQMPSLRGYGSGRTPRNEELLA